MGPSDEMPDALQRAFALVCAQAAEHTWMPGGEPLPFCQRCTGLYVGASLAFLLRWAVSLRPARLDHWIDGLLLLQMVPLGYHWVPQGPVLRTLSGLLFAFGLVGFLSLLPRTYLGLGRPRTPTRVRFLACAAALGDAAILLLVSCGGRAAHHVLALAGLSGLLLLAGLAVANLALTLNALLRALGLQRFSGLHS